MKWQVSRRQLFAGAVAAGAAVWVDMRWVEPRWLRVSRVPVRLHRRAGNERLRILHLSDLHFSSEVPLDYLRRSIQKGLAAEPDIVCLTGDLITRKIPDVGGYAETLRLLSSHCPTFACLGNHDGGGWARRYGAGYPDLQPMIDLLERSQIQLLLNTTRAVRVRQTTFQLIGVGDLWAGDARPENAFGELPPAAKNARIVLSHNPDSKQLLRPFEWDLMLCGHTHGGQLSLPVVGTPFAPVEDHRFVYGLNEWESRWIYTTSGVGNLHGMRFHCRPEVAVLDVL